MKKITLYVLFLLLITSTASISYSSEEKVPISMVTATSYDKELPFNIFKKKTATNDNYWRPEAAAEFVKLHIYSDEPTLVGGIEIESCNSRFNDKILAYINFDEKVATLESENRVKKAVYFKNPILLRSLTLNFQKNTFICIDELKILDIRRNPVEIITPDIVEGTVKASSTLPPHFSYDVMNLFDSRYEYAWASNEKAKGDVLEFSFNEAAHIKAIKIWNGYQRSDVHCYSNSRVKTLLLEGDKGYRDVLEVADEMGSQLIKLSKPFHGKKLKMTIKDSFPGKKYKDLVISEMRFFDGEKWFLLNPGPRAAAIAKANNNSFNKSNLNSVLNRSLVAKIKENKNEYNYREEKWTLRMRPDGSFFLESEKNTENEDTYRNEYIFALGNYEVKKSTADYINLRLFGILRTRAYEEGFGMDCNGCGRDCNLTSDPDENEKIFQEFIRIKNVDGGFLIKNISKNKKIDFNKLMMNVE